MSSNQRVTDQHMPRGMEVLDAYVARRGSITLDPQRVKALIGRATSMVMSGATATMDDLIDPWTRQLALYTATMGSTILALLEVDPKDSEALLKQMHADLERIDPAGAP
jgi:hypothetical protein